VSVGQKPRVGRNLVIVPDAQRTPAHSEDVTLLANRKVVLGLQPAAILPCELVEWSAMAAEAWRFTRDGKSATVRPSGPLRVNNGDAMMPALIAGTGLGILPEFILRQAPAAGQLERLLPDWSLPLGAVYWVTPPGGPRPKRVEVLGDFLVEKLSRHAKRGRRAGLASIR